jgi:hypothetical protein
VSFTQPAKIDLAAGASDTDGTVVSVSFYDGSKLIAQDTSAPYSYRWNGAGVGNHMLTARAVDNAGAAATSNIVTITVRKKR